MSGLWGSVIVIILQVLYTLCAVGLAAVGLHTLALAVLYWRHRHEAAPPVDPAAVAQWPSVVVQIAVYNERHVAERVIHAAGKLDYPPERLLVQVLDDSTDDTCQIAAAAVEQVRARGVAVQHLRRSSRSGFKAGALAEALEHTGADFIAVFDADFIPPPDFLRRTIPHFLKDDRLGMVQTRWAHVNSTASTLTRAQAIALDAHFVVEQTARHRAGLLFNFSGTGGIWRRTCLEDSGGWQADTLSEDIDLSYRAQLGGWRFLYLPGTSAPAEIPPLMLGFKRQQFRWAAGTIQVLKKLGGSLLRSELTFWQKLAGILHLGGYFLHPLMVLLLLLTLPLLLLDGLGSLPLAGLGIAMLGAPLEAIIGQRTLYPDWKKRLLYYPFFMLMGMGIAVSNALAVWQALRGVPPVFRRTPKFDEVDRRSNWQTSAYTLPVDGTTWAELGLMVYAFITAVVAVPRLPAVLPFMVLYAGGFAYVAGLSLWQARIVRRSRQRKRQELHYSGSRGR